MPAKFSHPRRRVAIGVATLVTLAAGLFGAAPAHSAGVSQISARGHVQDIGWQGWSTGDVQIGTTGRGLRLEALQTQIVDPEYGGGVATSVHVQNIGWMSPVTDGATAGTTGQGLRIEAVELSLTGEMADHYDLWYRAHVQVNGWLAWTSDGAAAGSEGLGRRMEALEMRLVPKGAAGPAQTGPIDVPFLADNIDGSDYLTFQAQVQTIGWQGSVTAGLGHIIRTTGRGLRMESFRVSNFDPYYGNVTAQAHVQNLGWMAPVTDGGVVGTVGQGLRMEAVRLSLENTAYRSLYTIWYRTHVQNIGWTGWAKNGEPSGSAGFGYRMEAMEVVMLNKYEPEPAGTGLPAFIQAG